MNEDRKIQTERLLLRPYTLSDVKDIVEGLNNLNVSKWLAAVPYPYTENDALEFINNLIENRLYNFAYELKSEWNK